MGAPWGLKVANSGQNSHPSHSKTQNGQKSAIFGPLVAKICNFGGVRGYRCDRLVGSTLAKGGPPGAYAKFPEVLKKFLYTDLELKMGYGSMTHI